MAVFKYKFMKKEVFICLFILSNIIISCQNQDNKQKCTSDEPVTSASTRQNIIFDTDMGSDCDDAGALALLHKYADKGEVNILGVIFSSGKNRYGAGMCDAINTWYGRGDIPLGQYSGNDVGDVNNYYSMQIATDTVRFPHNITDSAEDMLMVYKRILTNQPDSSVTIITVGHPHALYYLINDAEGIDLVRKKVQKCISMAGTGTQPGECWNFTKCGVAPYISDILERLPTAHYFSGAGTDVLTGHKLLPSTPENNPVREAYRLFGNSISNGRPSWDQIATLFAVKPELYSIDSIGSLVKNEDNKTYWDKNRNNHRHKKVIPLVPAIELEKMIEELMAEAPAGKTD
jgi:inosine-uridine nucleoside N-ribohydrolase